jgi:hypothetical protein
VKRLNVAFGEFGYVDLLVLFGFEREGGNEDRSVLICHDIRGVCVSVMMVLVRSMQQKCDLYALELLMDDWKGAAV